MFGSRFQGLISALSDDGISRATNRRGGGEGVWVLLFGRKCSTGTTGDSNRGPKGYQLHRTLALFALGLCIWPGLQILPAESPKLQRVDHGGLHLDPAHENPERGGGALIHGLLGLVHCI